MGRKLGEKKFYKKKSKCKYCKTTENLTIDHKIPKCQGGKDEIKNYQTLCYECNSIKSGLSHKEVLRYFRWFLKIQKSRVEKGRKPYTLK